MDSTMRTIRFLCLGVAAAAITACASPPSASQCEANGLICGVGTHCAAAQPICLSDFNLCGNAHMDDKEVCDDGNNIDGDGCSADCTSNERCGNGHLDQPIKDSAGHVVASDPRNEDCDTPLAVDAKSGLFCSAVCKFEKCGNMIIDKEIGEQCDDGNTVGGDGCSADCLWVERCGNGHKDQPFKDANGNPDLNDPRNEVCDDGNNVDGDGCSADCRSAEGCGNGTIDPGEECDDGKNPDGTPRNGDDKDCRSDCVINRCGDGRPNLHGLHEEKCDKGPLQPDGHREATPTEDAACNADCTIPSCGDGKVNHKFLTPDGPEQCDDAGANNNNADCTANCQVNVCGDNHQDTLGAHHENCDDGNRNDNDTCTNACEAKACGDGIVGPGEQCDDGPGNNGPHKRCNGGCQFNVCGDGDPLAGVEQCDGGNGVPRDVSDCNADCTRPACGDGHINTMAGEVCDDGPDNGKAGKPCSATCQLVSCGNGVREQDEACDSGDGHPKDSSTCDADCTLPVCGDNRTNHLAGEDCDEGAANGTLTSTCSVTCHTVSCGNGVIEQNEECDDGRNPDNSPRNKAGARCNASCKLNVCGDGDKYLGVEQCDSGGVNTAACDADCTLPVCGDTVTNLAAGEDCDQGVLNGTAASTCDAFCKFNSCGNNHVDIGEECDPGGGATPHDTAACNATCTLSRCGDGHTNLAALEACDEGASNGDPCAYGNPQCERCSNDCSDAHFKPGGPFCGDGIRQTAHEACDPGGGLTPADGPGCNADCTPVVCGDRHINTAAGEHCDDGNNDACGTCAAGCAGTAITASEAVGKIVVNDAAHVTDGDTFTLDDGFNPAVTFEFHVHTSGGLTGNTQVTIEDDATPTDVANAMIDAINTTPSLVLDITAVLGGTDSDEVRLTNDHRSSLGNTTIGRTGMIAGSMSTPGTFGFSDFALGAAGNCPMGTGCVSDDDCKFGCDTGLHTCKAAASSARATAAR